jgi:hypothetical protein
VRAPGETIDPRLGAHRGLATWGDRLVSLAEFRAAAAAAGETRAPAARADGAAALWPAAHDSTPVEGPYARIAVCGGVYSNHLALAAFLAESARRDVEMVYCLGDLGGFGPTPERIRPLVSGDGVRTVAGNYEESLASGREDCACGYTDPRDNHFAALSYLYTARHTPASFKSWMGELPARRRVRLGERTALLVHGSPRRTNEFLFDSTTPDAFLEKLLAAEACDLLLCTHTGLHWQRRLPSGRQAVNVGALGRPANDGSPRVWAAFLEADTAAARVELAPIAYDHRALAEEMRRERLPEEFVSTVLSGWWTTCLEILPAKERAAGRY